MASRTKMAAKPTPRTRTKRVVTKRKGKGRLPKLTFLERMPLSEQFIDRAITVSLVGLVGIALVGVALMSGLPGYVGTEMAHVVGRAGFAVKRFEITGIDRMDRDTVYSIATDQTHLPMPLVDLDDVRNRLIAYGWVEDARVSRRLPDTLVVDIVERKPAAVWQNNQKLSLIDSNGVVLERVNPDAVPDLPLLIGSRANREAVALNELMGKAPSLKPALASATWVGNRRWDLQFESGETLALPEGENAAGAALTRFVRTEGVERLLGRGFVRFDMRIPGKMTIRMNRAVKSSADSKETEEKAQTGTKGKEA